MQPPSGRSPDKTKTPNKMSAQMRGRQRSRSMGGRTRGSSYSVSSRSSSRGSLVPRYRAYRKKAPLRASSKAYLDKWNPFPAMAIAEMTYTESFQISNGAVGVPGHYLFRANGIFDPNYTGTGHQPYAHDTYATIYNHYQVLSSKIELTCMDSVNIRFGVSLIDDTTTELNYNTVWERKGTNSAVMVNGSQPMTVIKYYNSQFYDTDTDTEALFGASPNDSMFFDCWQIQKNSGTASANINFQVKITYTVKMWELKDLGSS